MDSRCMNGLIILAVISVFFFVIVTGANGAVDKEVPMPEINIELECEFIKSLLMIDVILKKIEEQNPEWFKERQTDGQK